MPTTVRIGRPGQFAEFERYARERMEAAALRASDKAARKATTAIRAALPGRLGGAIGAGSDLAKNGRAHPKGKGLSASGWVHIRGKSERAIGALISATEGATIIPKKGRWLARATDAIPRRVGRYKMTPDLYRSSGLEGSIGPLEFVPGKKSGTALLIVRNVTVDKLGRRGRTAKRDRGRKLHRSRERRDFIVAFVLFKSTNRAPVVDPTAIISAVAAELPGMIGAELRKDQRR